MPQPDICLEAFSRVVESIYDCAIEPERWRTTLPLICELTASPCGALAIHDYDQQATGRLYDYGYEEQYLKLYAERYAALNPLPARMQELPVGEPATTAMLVDEKEFFDSEFYTACLKPWHLRDSIGSVVLRSERRSALLFFNRKDQQLPYGASDLRLFRLIEPHVRRAVTISDLMDIKTLEVRTLSATLDNFRTGVIVVAADSRVLHANSSAQRMFGAGGPVCSANGRLSTSEAGARDELAHALALACSDEAGIGAGGIGIALSGARDQPAVAHVLPLTKGNLRTRLVPQATAAVFVSQAGSPLPADLDAIAQTFDLTRAEARVLEYLMQGLTIANVCQVLDIAETTAKTHLSHIFSKSGVARQSDLIALVNRLTPPIRRPTAP